MTDKKKEPEVGIGPCNDGRMHAFKSCDDGMSDFPMCGSNARGIQREEGWDPFCDACVPFLCAELGVDEKEFRATLTGPTG